MSKRQNDFVDEFNKKLKSYANDNVHSNNRNDDLLILYDKINFIIIEINKLSKMVENLNYKIDSMINEKNNKNESLMTYIN